MANNATDQRGAPVLLARHAAMRAHFSGRRIAAAAVAVTLLVAVVFGREVPWYLPAAVLVFAAATEIERVVADRARSLRQLENIILAIRILQMPLLVAGLQTLTGPVLATVALALVLVSISGFVSAPRMAIAVAAMSLAFLLVPAAMQDAGLTVRVLPTSPSEHYPLPARLAIALIAFPVGALLLHRRARRFLAVEESLTRAIHELRATQDELRDSQRQLERWNQELNEEVERKTDALGERNRYLTILNAISFALTEPMDDMGTLTRAVRLVARLLRARAAQASHRVTTGGQTTQLFVTVSPDDLHAPRLPEALLRTVAETGRPITSEDPAWTENLALPDLGEPYVVVPLVAKGRTLGAFALIGAGDMQWGDQERHLFLLIGREMGVALENARLYREALDAARREHLLAECSRILQEGSSMRSVAQALQLVADHLGTRDLVFLGLTGARRQPAVETHILGHGATSQWLRPFVQALPSLVNDRAEALVLGQDGEAPLSDALITEGISTLAISPIVTIRRRSELLDEVADPARHIPQRERVGVLVATLPHGSRWDQGAGRILARLSDMLAHRIEVDEYIALQRRRIAELGALANVARVVQSGSDVERLSGAFAQALATLLPYRRLYLARLSEFGELVALPVYDHGGHATAPVDLDAVDRTHAWFGLRAPRIWRQADGPTPGFPGDVEGHLLVVPMRPKGQLRGVATIVTDDPVGQDQLTIVEQAVEQFALALDNAWLYHQATARASHIQTLSNLARIVASIVDLREAFAAFAEEVRWLIPFDRAVMLLIDQPSGVVRPYATYPDGQALTEAVPLQGSVASTVVDGGGAVALARTDPQCRDLDWSVFGDASEVAAVPVRQGAQTAAVFAVMHETGGSYASLDLDGLDEVAGLLGVTIERLRLYEQAEYGARHDPLTDLPNYRYLQERLAELRHGISEPGATAVLQIDMDNLKPINDTLGHEAGDRLIQAVARRLTEAAGEHHFVARSGGDEFTMVMEGAGAPEAMQIADSLHAALRDAHLDVPGAPVRVGVSIGIAVAPDDGATPAELMHAADLAMYEAKFGGGTRTRLASDRAVASTTGHRSHRSHRIAETLVRSIVGAATPEERATLAVAQRWTAAAMIGARLNDDLISIARMLVALEALPRVTQQGRDHERDMAAFFIGGVREEWRTSGDQVRRTLADCIVPAAVDFAWRRHQPLGGPAPIIDFEAEAIRWSVDPRSVLWTEFVTAIRSDDRDQRYRPAA